MKMASQPYSKKVMELFMNPHNMGEMKDPDGKGVFGNPVCGDIMEIYIKVEEKKGKDYIKDVKFRTYGCASAIATSSMITDLVKGKSIEDAVKITKKDVADELGGLPPIKMHCSNPAEDAFRNAVRDYYEKSGKTPPKPVKEILDKTPREEEHACSCPMKKELKK